MWFTFRYTIPGSYMAIRLGSGQASIRGGAWEGRIFLSVSDSGSDRFLGTGGAGITGDMNGDAEESSTEAVRTRFIATRSTIGMHIFMETTADARIWKSWRTRSRPRWSCRSRPARRLWWNQPWRRHARFLFAGTSKLRRRW